MEDFYNLTDIPVIQHMPELDAAQWKVLAEKYPEGESELYNPLRAFAPIPHGRKLVFKPGSTTQFAVTRPHSMLASAGLLELPADILQAKTLNQHKTKYISNMRHLASFVKQPSGEFVWRDPHNKSFEDVLSSFKPYEHGLKSFNDDRVVLDADYDPEFRLQTNRGICFLWTPFLAAHPEKTLKEVGTMVRNRLKEQEVDIKMGLPELRGQIPLDLGMIAIAKEHIAKGPQVTSSNAVKQYLRRGASKKKK